MGFEPTIRLHASGGNALSLLLIEIAGMDGKAERPADEKSVLELMLLLVAIAQVYEILGLFRYLVHIFLNNPRLI